MCSMSSTLLSLRYILRLGNKNKCGECKKVLHLHLHNPVFRHYATYQNTDTDFIIFSIGPD